MVSIPGLLASESEDPLGEIALYIVPGLFIYSQINKIT